MFKMIKLKQDLPPYGKKGDVTQVVSYLADRLIRDGKAVEDKPRGKRGKPENKAMSAQD